MPLALLVLFDFALAAAGLGDTDEHVGVGSIVRIADEDGDELEVEISAVGGVSPESPLGVALMGAAVDDVVAVEAPSGSWNARVLAIRRA